MAIQQVAPVPGPFVDTNGLPNRLTCAFYSILNALVTSYDTRLQQWICKPLMFLRFNNL